MKAPLPPDETQRLETLQQYAVLDTPAEMVFDDLTELAAHICEAPIALISLIDEKRQWFKSRVGLDVAETTRDIAFCAHAIYQKELFIVPDATRDARFADNPLVMGEPGIRFYAGAPLLTSGGYVLGTLCVIDHKPREMSPHQQSALRVLSRHVMGLLELRRSMREAARLRVERDALLAEQRVRSNIDLRVQQRGELLADSESEARRFLATSDKSRLALLSVLEDQKQIEETLRESEKRFRATFEQAAVGIALVALDGRWLRVNQKLCDIVGYTREELLTRTFQDITYADDLDADFAYMHQMFANEILTFSREKRYHHKDGAIVWINLTVSLVRTDAGAPDYFVAVIEEIGERKQAQQALNENQRQLATLVSNLPGAAYRCKNDPAWTMEFVSDGINALTGYGPQAFLAGQVQVGQLIHPDDQQKIWQDKQQALEKKRPYQYEYRLLACDGQVKHIWERGQGIYNESGELLFLEGFLTDVTERKRMGEALIESEHHFKNVLDSLLAFAGTLTPDGVLTFANKTALNIAGITLKDVINKPLPDTHWFTWSKPVQQRVRDAIRRANAGEIVRYDEQLRFAGERLLDVEISIVALRDAAGRVTHLIPSGMDITARKHAEQLLQQSEALLKIAGRSAHLGGWVVNVAAGTVVWSDEVAAIHEVSPGTSPSLEEGFNFYAPEWREKITSRFGACVREGTPFEEELQIITATGRRVWVRSIGQAVRDASGAITQVQGSFQDISERKQAELDILKLNTELEQRVIERTAQLEAVNQELETFAYSVSHDLKAPLRGIDAYSRLLLEEHAANLNEEGSAFLTNIRNGTKQMAQLIEDLLAYSRIERRALRSESLDLPGLVAAVIAERADEIRARGVTVRTHISCREVAADPDGLAMALRNLFDNALKFTRDRVDATIEIGARREATFCSIWVRDNGIGFDIKFQERIFEIFQRLHRAEDFPGTGIGLAIVRKALQRMGGRAWAESVLEEGATFYLEVPI